MRARAIRHVDAFTTVALEGNPAAVVDGGDISAETMQRIALNQHLSETVFLLPPRSADNDAWIRIFTPGAELPFAGHPTIAAAHIITEEKRVALSPGEALRLETGAGVIPVIVGDGASPLYTMTQAAPVFSDAGISLADIGAALALNETDVVRAERVSTGVEWLIAQISSLDAMMRVRPDMMALMKIPHGISIFCIGALDASARVHVRSFAPAVGVMEDPVTGSSNGCIAAMIAKHQLLPATAGEITYVAEQGIEMGQPGRVYARVSNLPHPPTIHIGGHAVTVLRGELLLPGA